MWISKTKSKILIDFISFRIHCWFEQKLRIQKMVQKHLSISSSSFITDHFLFYLCLVYRITFFFGSTFIEVKFTCHQIMIIPLLMFKTVDILTFDFWYIILTYSFLDHNLLVLCDICRLITLAVNDWNDWQNQSFEKAKVWTYVSVYSIAKC